MNGLGNYNTVIKGWSGCEPNFRNDQSQGGIMERAVGIIQLFNMTLFFCIICHV